MDVGNKVLCVQPVHPGSAFFARQHALKRLLQLLHKVQEQADRCETRSTSSAAALTAQCAAGRRRRKPLQKLKQTIRNRLRAVLRRCKIQKSSSALTLAGCSLDMLRAHLEAQFVPGMTWANHGAWHVDHIRPCASFNLEDPAEQRVCFHFSNLQPLWAQDNLAKGATWAE